MYCLKQWYWEERRKVLRHFSTAYHTTPIEQEPSTVIDDMPNISQTSPEYRVVRALDNTSVNTGCAENTTISNDSGDAQGTRDG